MAGYVLGIDSGGTHYRVLAADEQGRQLGIYSGKSASHYYLPKDEMLKNINHNIDQCLAVFGGHRKDCLYLVCGTTGLDSKEDEEILMDVYGKLDGFTCPVCVINDAELAHHTVTGGVGALVISGTGSIAFGRNGRGETARAGGWMFSIMGEEGSGSWISRMALRHLGRWLDGVVEKTPLAALVSAETGVTSHKQLMDLAVKIATPPWDEPKLGGIVDQAAAQGDPYAKELITRAANEIFNLVSSLITKLGLDNDPSFKIGIWGSNIVNSSMHQEIFTGLVRRRYPNGTVVLPKRSAAEGAADIALERLNRV